MTKTEMNRFRAVLTARVAELERVTRHRDAIFNQLIGTTSGSR